MQTLRAIETAHENLKESLHDWFRAKETFDNENEWPEGPHGPYSIIQRIETAATDIYKSVGSISQILKRKSTAGVPKKYMDKHLMSRHANYIDRASSKMSEAVEDGTEAMLDPSLSPSENPSALSAWKELCGAVNSYSLTAADELIDLRKNYLSDSTLFEAILGLRWTAEEAMRCSKMLNRRNLEH
jgi:hypothetical protein